MLIGLALGLPPALWDAPPKRTSSRPSGTIDVLIFNHSGFDEAPAKLAALRKASHGPNPFVLKVMAVK